MTKRIGFLILIFCLNAKAENFEGYQLQHWPATAAEIEASSCRYPVAQTNQEILEYFATLKTTSQIKKTTIFGVTFHNESFELLSIFHDLTEAASASENPEPERQLNIKDKFSIRDTCDKVYCAAEKIFGQQEYLKVLYLYSQFHLNTSYVRYQNADNMNDEELKDILNALRFIPTNMSRLKRSQMLIHFLRDPSLPENNSKPIANHSMTLFKRWAEFNRIEKAQIIFHEFSHNWGNVRHAEKYQSERWQVLSQWQEGDGEDVYTSGLLPAETPRGAWVSLYGQKNPAEDFAEAVAAYRFVPFRLKAISPAKYNFIKEQVFNGTDFENADSCNNKKLYSEVIFADIVQQAPQLMKDNHDSIASECSTEKAASARGAQRVSDCVASQLIQNYFNQHKNQYGEVMLFGEALIPNGFFDRVTARPNYSHPSFMQLFDKYKK